VQVITVPVKRLERAKRRLAPVLSPAERAMLTLAMLEDVLDACLVQPGWDSWVVSRSEAVLEVSARRGARPVPEDGASLLEAVRQVEAGLRTKRDRLAVVLGDLPLISEGALGAALALEAPVVAAPSFSDGGTNVLVRRPASVMPARFGRESFAKHRRAAERAGVAFAQVDHPELAFDLDRPDDLLRAARAETPTRTRAACLELGLTERFAGRR
jgi:2-phospho-L-lactate/phosphoenolpyruvate guanylyltransferase